MFLVVAAVSISCREDVQLSEIGILEIVTRLRVEAVTGVFDLDHATALGEPRVTRVPEALDLANFEH